MRENELIKEADNLILHGDFEEAAQKLNHVLIISPTNSNAKRKLLNIYVELDETNNSLDLVCELLQEFKYDNDLLFTKANCLNDLDQLNESLELYNMILANNPKYYLAYGGRGIVYYKLKDYDKAISDLNLAIEHEKKNGYLFNQRALIYIDLADYNSALQDLDKALRLDKSIEEARFNRAIVLRMLGKKEKALKDINNISTNLELGSDSYLQKGIVYFKNKEYLKALEYYDLAIEANPNNVDALYSRSIVFCEMKDFEKSFSEIKMAESIAPPDFMDYILNMYAY